MKKKMVVISTVALLILFAAMPALQVLAEPIKGQKVPVTSIFIPPPEVQLGENRLTEGGVFLFTGRVEIYRNNKLSIGSDPPLTVCAYLVGSGSVNTKTEVMIIHWDSLWYISTEGSPDGFAGNTEMKLFGYDSATRNWETQTMHLVLHGFGAYEGQTLMLSYDGPKSGVSTGYCLKG